MTASPRYFIASILLLVALVGGYAVSAARRTQAELATALQQKGMALAETVETSSRNAIRSNALMEQMIAERLLDNARLVDALMRRPLPPGEIARVAEANRLRRIDLLDRDGRPWTPPPGARSADAPPIPPADMPGMMQRMMRGSGRGTPEDHAAMMRYMWGRRWAAPPDARGEGGAPVPPAIQDRKFWEGSVFGVAIGARSFPGIIAVHADAAYILNFWREIGVERQIEELGRQPGVSGASLLDGDRVVLADSDPARVGRRDDDPLVARAAAERRATDGIAARGGSRVFEVVRPLALDGSRVGLLALAFSTEPMERAWRADVRAGALVGGGVLLVGAIGLGLIFWTQHRHLAEVRALETEMARRERLAAVGDVAAAFAHEVRNPLNAVSMGLQRLRAEWTPAPTGEYERVVDLMQGEVRRLNTIVEQFIALARPLPLAPAPLALDDLVTALVALVTPQARAAGVTVETRVPAELTVTADRDRLQQVLLNLALNGIQAMGAGGTLSIEGEATRDRVVLTVTDTGPGIPADALSRVFDPYFSTRRDGLGLGLTIARRIVEAHGGTLEASNVPGRGARFRVALPRERSTRTSPSASRALANDGSRGDEERSARPA